MPNIMQKTILLVEDEAILVITEKAGLEKYGYKVITVDSGEKAIDFIFTKKEPIDLILMDINLGGGIDGTEAAQEILKEHNIPILFLSSHTEKDIVEKTEKITSYGYVVKASSFTVLDASIKMAFKLFEANHKIFESEIKQKVMLSNIADVIVIIDKEGINRYKSQNITKWFGWKPEELIGQSTWDVVHPDDLIDTQLFFTGIMKTPGAAGTTECRYLCKNGDYTIIEITLVNLLHDPVIRGVLGNYHDISMRKKSEQEQLILAALIDNSNDTAIVKDLDRRIISCNKNFIHATMSESVSDLFGKTDADILGISENDEPARSYMLDDLKALQLKPGESISREEDIPSPDGRIRTYITKKFPLAIASEIIGIGVMTTDITDRKQMEDALLAEKLFSESLISNLPGVFYLISEEGKFLRWNTKFEEVTGRSTEEMAQISPIDLFEGEDKQAIASAIQRVFTHGQVQVEGHFVARNGKRTPYQFSGDKIMVDGVPSLIGLGLDITDRKQAEQLLDGKNRMLNSLLENLPIGVFMVEAPSGKPLVANEIAKQLLGRGVLPDVNKESIGDVYQAFKKNTNEKYPLDEMPILRGLRGEKSHIEDMVVLRPDGTISLLEVYGSPIIGKDGIVSASIVSFLDITGRKNSEEKIRLSESNLSSLINNREDAIWSIDRNYNILIMNSFFKQEYLRIFKQELSVGISGLDIISPEMKPLWKSNYDKALSGEKVVFEFSVQKVNPVQFYEVYLNPIVVDGGIEGVSAISMNITERKKVEDKIIEQQNLSNQYLQIANVMMLVLNYTGEIILINKKGLDILGYGDEQELLGKNWFETTLPNEIVDEVKNVFNQLISGISEPVEYYENSLLTKNGDSRIIAFHNRLLRDKDGNISGILSSGDDITERKHAESALKQIEWMLSENLNSNINSKIENHDQGYGDLTALNIDGLILKSIGPELLKNFSNDYLDLLGTSSAVYEKNGDYAFGIFSSGWCRMMDSASRKLCNTSDNIEALKSGKWLCHDSCWWDCSKEAIDQGIPNDIECAGGIRLYAEPIIVRGRVVGAINFGYGNPPVSKEELQKLADKYHISYDDLLRESSAYEKRPPYIINMAKKRLHTTALLIGSIIETKQAEEAVNEQLKEKEIILEEVNHRVKNNMNTIYGLLFLQSESIENEVSKNVLLDAAGRVQTMTNLYDKLYRSESNKIISIKEHLHALIGEIVSIFPQKVSTEIEIDEIVLSSKVLTPLAIVINELITNSMKYAFTGRSDGVITVKVNKIENRVSLTYEDNGAGIPESVTFENATGFGMKLVLMLVEQMNGTIAIERNKGTKFIIEFEA